MKPWTAYEVKRTKHDHVPYHPYPPQKRRAIRHSRPQKRGTGRLKVWFNTFYKAPEKKGEQGD